MNVRGHMPDSTSVQMVITTTTMGAVPHRDINAQLVVAHYPKPSQQQSDHFIRTKTTDTYNIVN